MARRRLTLQQAQDYLESALAASKKSQAGIAATASGLVSAGAAVAGDF